MQSEIRLMGRFQKLLFIHLHVLLLAVASTKAATPLPNVDEETQRRLTTYALANAYTEAEAQLLLRGLDQLPSRPTPALPSLPVYKYPTEGPCDHRLTAVVNPTCSECGRILDLLLAEQRKPTVPGRALDIMLLPNDSRPSKTAVALLDWVREHAPDVFLPLLLDLTAHEPQASAQVFEIAINYTTITPQLRTAVIAAAKESRPRSTVDEPTFFYRGRSLSPVRVNNVVYDPLKNAVFLSEALATIDRYYTAH